MSPVWAEIVVSAGGVGLFLAFIICDILSERHLRRKVTEAKRQGRRVIIK